jgi:hypothetical protein
MNRVWVSSFEEREVLTSGIASRLLWCYSQVVHREYEEMAVYVVYTRV